MNKYFRIILLIVLLLGIVGLAQNQVAWAANPAEKSANPALKGIEKSVSPDKDDDCNKPWNQHKDRCKDKDKDKDKCKKHREDCGTVKPPPHQVVISTTGQYSVGGFCTLSVVLSDPAIALDASIEAPLPRDLPDKVHKVSQGCHLVYYNSGKRIGELPPASGTVTICFAATPQKPMTIYFNDIYSPHPKWVALETTVNNGIACAAAPTSGVYVASFRKP